MTRIPLMSPSLSELENQYVNDALSSTWIGGAGQYIDKVESLWAEICDVEECVLTSNGTTALHLSLLAADIRPGDEVIVPSLTYAATANAVRFTGAEPVFVDVDPITWCIDPEKAERAVTRRTKAILAVPLLGHPADMDSLREVSDLYKLHLLSDSAQSHLAKYKGRTVGSIADMEAFSFHVGKAFSCGEGGAITLNDKKTAKWLRHIRGHGMDPRKRYWHPTVAFNYRITNVQAAILLAQLERRISILEKRCATHDMYKKLLEDVPGIEHRPSESWAEQCPWLVSMIIDEQQFGMHRDQLMEALDAHSIETRPLFPPLHQQPHFRELAQQRGDLCPIAERLADAVISLPSSTDITEEEILKVCQCIIKSHEQSKGHRMAA